MLDVLIPLVFSAKSYLFPKHQGHYLSEDRILRVSEKLTILAELLKSKFLMHYIIYTYICQCSHLYYYAVMGFFFMANGAFDLHSFEQAVSLMQSAHTRIN